MTKTIALSEQVYSELKELKEAMGIGYSELIKVLIKEYKKQRVKHLKELAEKLRLPEEEVLKVKEVIKKLRRRSWW